MSSAPPLFVEHPPPSSGATHVETPDTGEMNLREVLRLAKELRSYDTVNIHYTY